MKRYDYEIVSATPPLPLFSPTPLRIERNIIKNLPVRSWELVKRKRKGKEFVVGKFWGEINLRKIKERLEEREDFSNIQLLPKKEKETGSFFFTFEEREIILVTLHKEQGGSTTRVSLLFREQGGKEGGKEEEKEEREKKVFFRIKKSWEDFI